MSSNSGSVRIPSLDGLRAVSITMVILGHGLHAMPQDWPDRWPLLFGVIGNGGLGVSVFFVISGFLITSLLLKEESQTGSISLRNFYVRRFFRIVPPFYVYLFCLLLLSGLGCISVGRGSFLAALCFVKDYNYLATDWWTIHSWSLSIEEQFYLLWPAALALLERNTAKKLALWIVGAGPITHVVSHIFFHQIGPREIFMFQIRADALMLGSLLALYEGTLLLDKVKAISAPLALIGIGFLAIGDPYLSTRFRGWYTFPFGYSIEYATIALALLYVVNHPLSRAGKVLNHRWAVHIGVISYSLYLWQQLFLTPLNSTWTGRVPLSFLCTLLAAELSWFIIEKPALRWRRRFELPQKEKTPFKLERPESLSASAD